jgi:transcriptional regulator with XRE-family HTH domain
MRKDAGLQGKELADRAGWAASKVTRIELGRQRPTESDVAVWCRICGTEDQIPDLQASVRNIESLYMELRRSTAGGMRKLQDDFDQIWRSASLFRIYEPFIIPGLFQTAEYARAILAVTANRLGAPNDIEAALAARMRRQEVLYEGARRFLVVIEEHALRTVVADPGVMLGQYDRLLSVMGTQRCSLGIIPANAHRAYVLPSEGFWIYDESRAMVETRSAIVTITKAREIDIYADVFERLQRLAVYGPDARRLIMNATGMQS